MGICLWIIVFLSKFGLSTLQVTDPPPGDCPPYATPVPARFTLVYPQLYKKVDAEAVSIPNTEQSSGSHASRFIIKMAVDSPERHRLLLKQSELLSESSSNAGAGGGVPEDKSLVLPHMLELSCYYQGVCRKHTKEIDEYAFLRTCRGLQGVMTLNHTLYSIRPLNNQGDVINCAPHLMAKLPPAPERRCGNGRGLWQPFNELDAHKSEYNNQISSQASLAQTSPELQLKLGIVLDKSLKGSYDDEDFHHFIVNTVNILDSIYQSSSVRIKISLSFMKLLEDKDTQAIISSNVRETLQNFLLYTISEFSEMQYDVVHLLTSREFDGVDGMAVPDAVCTKPVRAVAVETVDIVNSSYHAASLIAHMLGHNLGLQHDLVNQSCLCTDERNGCIMQTTLPPGSNSPYKFSSCSEERLKLLSTVGLLSCLAKNSQTLKYSQYCGDEVVQRGEECDCGPSATCSRVSPCCNATTCMLKTSAACLDGPCCHGCQLVVGGRMCRPAHSECDVPEFCTGSTLGECPKDVWVRTGEPCGGGEGFCRRGHCPLRSTQCERIWGPGARVAHSKCFNERNVLGSAEGNCGRDHATEKYKKCETSDVLCGLLQCQGGQSTPIHSEFRPSELRAGSGENARVCKTVTNTSPSMYNPDGMVGDGTKCGVSHVCHGNTHVCRQVAHPPNLCPIGPENNKTCSGNGKCTSANTCFCDYNYGGPSCSMWLNLTAPGTSGGNSTGLGTRAPGGRSDKVDPQLVILVVISAIVILVLVILIVCCYRRRNPTKSNGPAKLGSSYMDSTDSYSFSSASTPNKYDRRRKRRRRRVPRYHDTSSEDDTQDEDDMHESSQCASPPVPRYDIPIPEELSRQPEKSILKKTASFGAGSAARGPYYSDVEEGHSSGPCSCCDGEDGADTCSCSEEGCVERHSHGGAGSSRHSHGSQKSCGGRGSASRVNEGLDPEDSPGSDTAMAPHNHQAMADRLPPDTNGLSPAHMNVSMDTDDYSVVYAPVNLHSTPSQGPAPCDNHMLGRPCPVLPLPEEGSLGSAEALPYVPPHTGSFYRQFSAPSPNGPHSGLGMPYATQYDRCSQQDSATDSAIEMNDHHLPLEAQSISSAATTVCGDTLAGRLPLSPQDFTCHRPPLTKGGYGDIRTGFHVMRNGLTPNGSNSTGGSTVNYDSPPRYHSPSDELDISSHKQQPPPRDSLTRLHQHPGQGTVFEPPRGSSVHRHSLSSASSSRGDTENGDAYPDHYRKLSLSTFQPLPPKAKVLKEDTSDQTDLTIQIS